MPPKRVLIVDDHPYIRSLLRALVETDDFRVCGEAMDGVDAIEKADKLRPDLILLDFTMPRMNGDEVARIVKNRMPAARIILFTLDEESVNKVFAASMCVDRVVAKPDGMTKLVPCMREVVGLEPKRSSTIGPLSLPVEDTSKVNETPPVGISDEEPPA
jgi:CheY-like chemotaxis protein